QVMPAVANPVAGEPMPAPLAGNIWKVNVTPGQSVQEGDVVLILEAMKMETEVRAPRAGQVVAVSVREGDSVAVGDQLLMLAL
ncbi:MAG: biotin/lipoyl-containing protein, partial [Endozoicomonas sp.]